VLVGQQSMMRILNRGNEHVSTQTDIAVPSIQDAQDAIRVLFKPGQVVELRAFGTRGKKVKKKFILSGYYNDHDRMAEDVIRMSNTPGVSGVFWSIQKIDSALLARSPNRFIEGPEATTSDVDVKDYVWLPIDIDPVRAAGISSTDAEKQAAREVLEKVVSFFKDFVVTAIEADSGNGYHALVAVELPATDAPLVSRVLAALDERFSTDNAKIDRTVFNASRILKCYGSVARKGESVADRPHCRAFLLKSPGAISACLSRDVLEKIAATAPPEPEKKTAKKAKDLDLEKSTAKVEEFLAEGKIAHGPRLEYKGAFKWLLETCPFNPEHIAPSIIVTIADTGAMGFKCSHNSCFDKSWQTFRKYVEEKLGHAFVFRDKAKPLDAEHIVTNPGHITEMVRRSERVLYDMGMKYFERSNELVITCYGRDVPEIKDIERAKDSVVIIPASTETIVRDLDSRATFVILSATADGIEESVVHVPGILPDQLHDRVHSEGWRGSLRSTPQEQSMGRVSCAVGAPAIGGADLRRLSTTQDGREIGVQGRKGK
jgi:hypothetical protein